MKVFAVVAIALVFTICEASRNGKNFMSFLDNH